MIEKKCARCGEIKPVSEFHKDNNMKSGFKSWCKKCVKEEYNLHRDQRYKTTKMWKKEHSSQVNEYCDKARQRKYQLIESLKTPCVKCGESRRHVIEFHHINPLEKEFNVGRSDRSRKSIVDESKKCICLCANCHNEYHYFYGQKPEKPVETLQKYLKGENKT